MYWILLRVYSVQWQQNDRRGAKRAPMSCHLGRNFSGALLRHCWLHLVLTVHPSKNISALYYAETMTIRLIEASEEHLPAIARIATSAFHPNTDALSRRLFPPHLQPTDLTDGEAAYDWRFARKASSLASPESHLVVAIDDEKAHDDQVVGFSLWDAPPATGGDSGPSKEIQCTALDKKAYNEMKKTVNQDAVDTFGEQGIAGVWRTFPISLSRLQ